MTEQQAILAAICSQPEDDTVRLVYADWLDEHEQPDRAEFIRYAVPNNKKPRVLPPGSPAIMQMVRNSPEDADQFDVTVATINIAAAVDGLSWTVTRGFASSVTCPWQVWENRHHEIAWHRDHRDYDCPLTAQPIEEVKLTTAPPTMRHPDDRANVLQAFKHKWPWIKFDLPTAIETLIHRHATDEAEADARAYEGIVREIAGRTGIRLPNEAARVTRLDYSGPDNYPVREVACNCETRGFSLSRLSLVDMADPPTFMRVQLRSINRWVDSRRSWRFAYGRCDRCGMIYYSISREPNDFGTRSANEPRSPPTSRT